MDQNTLHDAALNLTDHLGEGWDIDVAGEGESRREHCRIRRADGAMIVMKVPYGCGRRVEVSGHAGCADYHLGRGWGAIEVPAITVAMDRGADAIVRDVTRRFLPRFLAGVREAREKQSRLDQERGQAQRVGKTIAEILGEAVSLDGRGGRRGAPGGEVYSDEPSVTVKVQFHGVEFRADSITPELAIRLAQTVAQYRRELVGVAVGA